MPDTNEKETIHNRFLFALLDLTILKSDTIN
ncbi:hypothetical protein Solca_0743 [Solitalea canadensis DSM 3403]|uniref:Uncharacterized protein n=1 Tax=Solitalea canadensis (strain ATCC 29591 / DSM 3403 / JCM 21819 / LMG 8368 / NBRC 15130 / NCIMB 12057 / USAM 9D) TaxID=929556 RepID=H8KPG7_SOLCM|nr:hypothetical protein Solca_0743 [Solitalea canadensis DSM 3403]